LFGLWCDGSSGLDIWVEGVADGGGLLAGLDGELGSISQELVGSTAAESFSADWSWLWCSIGQWSESAAGSFNGSGIGGGWSGGVGLNEIGGLNAIGGDSGGLIRDDDVLEGSLSKGVTDGFAVVLGGSDHESHGCLVVRVR